MQAWNKDFYPKKKPKIHRLGKQRHKQRLGAWVGSKGLAEEKRKDDEGMNEGRREKTKKCRGTP